MVGRLEGEREARQVLRYWLGALRFEESLASRPRAQRPEPGDTTTDAAASQPYFRLGGEHAAFLTGGRGEAVAAMEPGLTRFHRHWSWRALRPRRAAGEDDKTAKGSWVAGWPAVFFERRDEIATLLRFPVTLAWRRGGAPWEAPDRQAPRDGPDEVVIRAAEGDEDEPNAFAIDRHLLHTTLGLLDEEIAELEARWRDAPAPAAVLAALLRGLGAEVGAAAAADPARLLRDVVDAIARRLPRGVAVYPTGIVQDASLVFGTHHLQRELLELVALPTGAAPLKPGTALWAYLCGAPNEGGRAELRGRFRARGLTGSQRAVAELALGSRLAAAQGPPGTGKTEVILNLAAHALVERIEGWDRGRSMSQGLMVVASTNNRAVDNAIDPIGAETPADRLPFALRCGNQELTRTVTARELARARAWLLARPDAAAAEQLEAARAELRLAGARLREINAPYVARLRHETLLATIRRDLANTPETPFKLGDQPEENRTHDGLIYLRDELARMVRSARSRKSKGPSSAKRWAQMTTAHVGPLLHTLPGLAAALPSPPAAEDKAAWRETLDDALEVVTGAIEELRAGRRAAERRGALAAELAALEAKPAAALDASVEGEIEARAHAVFLAALEVRERWAITQRETLIPLLERAESAASGRSVRRLFEAGAGADRGLRVLYPVVGCTLLSLGNVLEHGAGEIDTLVVDEAGQCHPAYPVSGLARARRAVLIGDVQQLPPVVTLSARDEARIRRAARITIDEERFAPFVVHDEAGTSAQALADRAVPGRPAITDHFRCQPEIIGLSGALCGYHLTVHTPVRSLSRTVARLRAPVLFDAVPGEQARARGSWANEAEAARLVELLAEMRAAGVSLAEIGVLTPYVGQLELLRQLLRRRGVPLESASDDREVVQPTLFGAPDVLATGTVHRFQGGERSVILLSTAITRTQNLGFLDDLPNLLNVAISRARDHLVTFGCEPVLRAGRRTRLLVERAARLP